jgi:hypothetical protein
MLVAHFRAHWSCFTEQNAMLFSESDGKERNREVNKAGKRVGRAVTRRIARHSIKYADNCGRCIAQCAQYERVN